MEEVEYLCSRLGIIDHGKVIALGEKDELKRSVIDHDKIEIEVNMITPTVIKLIEEVPAVESVTVEDKRLTIYSNDGPELLANVLSVIAKMNIKALSVKVEEPNLESVFLKLTGRALRD
jgi:ABC-2 type transport system ATP-binding protein